MISILKKEHIDIIDRNFLEQKWDSRKNILEKYLQEQNNEERIVFVDTSDDDCRGYITLVIKPKNGVFSNRSIPEIVDFNVFEKYQKQGIGNNLLNIVIDEAKKYSKYVGIGVGLNANYGNAQRLYVKNGFIPDGKGIYYKDKIVETNAICINDDDLAMYFIKTLDKI